MPARSTRTANPVADATPEMPQSLDALCAAVRNEPFLLNRWAERCPPEALLAGVMNEAVVWGAVPQEHQLIVQAAAQMISAVRAGVGAAQLLEQPAIKAWLKERAEPANDLAGLARLRRLAAGEAVFEVRKDMAQCQALLEEFHPELQQVDERLGLAVRALREHADAAPEGLGCSAQGDKAGRAWLEARMAAAYLANDEKLSGALRAALHALGSR